jgi:uncharacterized ferritin-like protein (DUF455 family)
MTTTPPLAEMADAVLRTADAREKTALSRRFAALWQEARSRGRRPEIGTAAPPDRPTRPGHPELRDPRDVPRRRPGSARGRRAILHAVAHIELNAVDLHWDVIARFSATPMPIGFFDDWVRAADEESKHFNLVADVLEAMDCPYGALPAHAGMWRAAEDTAHDLMARLAVVPMVLEARGLDVTPGMIDIFRRAMSDPDDGAAAGKAVAALEVIYAEEVHHVAYGAKWFHFLCGRQDTDPKDAFHALVQRHFHGALKPPFNEEKRAEAGLPPDFYWPLAEGAGPAR